MMDTGNDELPWLVDRLIEPVFNRIASGELEPYSKGAEQQLAGDFGVSRTRVREAIRRLSEMGLLTVRPRCGLEISPVGDLKELAQIREELETFALRLAMPQVTGQDIEAIRSGDAEAADAAVREHIRST